MRVTTNTLWDWYKKGLNWNLLLITHLFSCRSTYGLPRRRSSADFTCCRFPVILLPCPRPPTQTPSEVQYLCPWRLTVWLRMGINFSKVCKQRLFSHRVQHNFFILINFFCYKMFKAIKTAIVIVSKQQILVKNMNNSSMLMKFMSCLYIHAYTVVFVYWMFNITVDKQINNNTEFHSFLCPQIERSTGGI